MRRKLCARGRIGHVKRLIVIVGFILASTPSLACAIQVVVQAEQYTSANDIAYVPIQPNISYLEGLDYPGEWTQYQLQTTGFGTYQVTLKCWGALNVSYHLQLVTMPVQGDNPAQTIGFSFIGRGSCGA